MRHISKHRIARVFQKIKGYTLIEVIVVTSIIAILASLVVLNLTEARKTARDTRRKSDIQTYVSALNSYRVTNPNFFVEDKKNGTGGCTNGIEILELTDSNCVKTDNGSCSKGDALNTGQSCVGALGRAYGKMNLASTDSESVKDGYKGSENSEWARTYAKVSIAQALLDQGYINNISKDPSNKSSANTDPSQPDYTLVRACANGRQTINKGGVLFTVFGILEKNTNSIEKASTQEYAGINPKVKDNSGIITYQYDFANRDFYDSDKQSRAYGVGNAPVTSDLQSLNWSSSLDCSQN